MHSHEAFEVENTNLIDDTPTKAIESLNDTITQITNISNAILSVSAQNAITWYTNFEY